MKIENISRSCDTKERPDRQSKDIIKNNGTILSEEKIESLKVFSEQNRRKKLSKPDWRTEL